MFDCYESNTSQKILSFLIDYSLGGLKSFQVSLFCMLYERKVGVTLRSTAAVYARKNLPIPPFPHPPTFYSSGL